MGGWLEFALALGAFFLSHAIPVRPPVRTRLIAMLGRRGYFIGYSMLSVLILVWLVIAAGRAPYVEVIPSEPWLRWVPVLVMPFVCLLVAAGMLATNPLSFGGLGKAPYDPAHPGVLRFCRHPLLLALMLWSLAHLLANGSLAHVILFGLFAVFAGLGMWMIDRRRRGELGPIWERWAEHTSLFAPQRLAYLFTLRAVVFAGLGYVGLLFLHMPVIGLSPLP